MLQKQWSKYFFNFHNLNLILISNSILCIIAWLSTLTVPSQLQDGNLEAYPYELFIFASSIMLIFAVWFIVNLGNYIFEHINENLELTKKIYKYMIKKSIISGKQICYILMEQQLQMNKKF